MLKHSVAHLDSALEAFVEAFGQAMDLSFDRGIEIARLKELLKEALQASPEGFDDTTLPRDWQERVRALVGDPGPRREHKTVTDESEPCTCRDCGVSEGEIHAWGCDTEICPFCSGQLLTCGCCYKHLGFDYDVSKPYSGLPEHIYSDGLTTAMDQTWQRIVEDRGRVPYLRWPQICSRCARIDPVGQMVSDAEWERVVPPNHRRNVICASCFNDIAALLEANKVAPVAVRMAKITDLDDYCPKCNMKFKVPVLTDDGPQPGECVFCHCGARLVYGPDLRVGLVPPELET